MRAERRSHLRLPSHRRQDNLAASSLTDLDDRAHGGVRAAGHLGPGDRALLSKMTRSTPNHDEVWLFPGALAHDAQFAGRGVRPRNRCLSTSLRSILNGYWRSGVCASTTPHLGAGKWVCMTFGYTLGGEWRLTTCRPGSSRATASPVRRDRTRLRRSVVQTVLRTIRGATRLRRGLIEGESTS